MLYHLIFALAVAQGAEVVPYRPEGPAPTLRYRELLRRFLRTSKYPAGVKAFKASIAGVRGATAILIALEEAAKVASERSDGAEVVARVFTELAGIEIGNPTDAERAGLRAGLAPYVDLFYQDRRAKPSFRDAVVIYDRLGPRGPRDVKYLIEDVRTMPYLIGAREKILAILPELESAEVEELHRAILANPGKALMRWTLLDEIGGTLAPEFLRGAVDLMMHELAPGPKGWLAELPTREREVYVRALVRWQQRYLEGDPATVDAVDAVTLAMMKRDHTVAESRFLTRLVRGLLPTEVPWSRLSAHDPLGLYDRAPVAGNVIPFDCRVNLEEIGAAL